MTMGGVRLVEHPDKQSLSDAVGARLVTALVDAQSRRGVARLVLTGGSMGSAVLASAATTPGRSAVDWTRVEVWWGDERYLAAGDPDRNDVQNDEAGLSGLGLVPRNVHRVAGPDLSASAEESAAAYAGTLADVDAFDVVLLGVGPDGHVASLFPGHPAQLTEGDTVAVHDSPKPPPTRVSLTASRLCRSRQVWFLVAGRDKAGAVTDGLELAAADRSSAALVMGTEATLWLVDRDAAEGVTA